MPADATAESPTDGTLPGSAETPPGSGGTAPAAGQPSPRVGGKGTEVGTRHNPGLKYVEKFGLLIAWAAVIAGFGIARPDPYLTTANFANILGSQAVLIVLSLGLLVSLRTGLYDLSVAANLTMTSCITGVLNVEYDLPIVMAIAAGLAVSLLIGLFNAFFVVVIGIDSLVVTLGTATLLQGLAIQLTNAQTITGVSENLVNLVIGTRIGGIPLEFFYAVAITAACWLLFQYTPLGRRLLYVGHNPNVARLSGVSVGRVRCASLVLTALVSGVAGIIYTGTSGVASHSSGLSYMLPAFAACFLGATTIRVGEFNAWGTIAAAYFLISGVTGLAILGMAAYVQQVFYGAALILAVTLSKLAERRIVRE